MPDISLCADHYGCRHETCKRHPARYDPPADYSQSWASFAGTGQCIRDNKTKTEEQNVTDTEG